MSLKTRTEDEEGLRLTAYPDPESPLAAALALPLAKRPANWESLSGAPWTEGYGHTGPDVHPGDHETLEKAESDLDLDIAKARAALAHFLPWTDKLDPVRRDVLVGMTFNMGIGGHNPPRGLLGFVNALPLAEQGQYHAAADHFLNSRWAKQTKTRAMREMKIFVTGIDE